MSGLLKSPKVFQPETIKSCNFYECVDASANARHSTCIMYVVYHCINISFWPKLIRISNQHLDQSKNSNNIFIASFIAWNYLRATYSINYLSIRIWNISSSWTKKLSICLLFISKLWTIYLRKENTIENESLFMVMINIGREMISYDLGVMYEWYIYM